MENISHRYFKDHLVNAVEGRKWNHCLFEQTV